MSKILLAIASLMLVVSCAATVPDMDYTLMARTTDGKWIYYIGNGWVIQCSSDPLIWQCHEWIRKVEK
jgi:hypothetical protein